VTGGLWSGVFRNGLGGKCFAYVLIFGWLFVLSFRNLTGFIVGGDLRVDFVDHVRGRFSRI